MILAQGLLLGPRSVPAAGVQVNLIRQTDGLGDAISVRAISDSEGRFQAWVPNAPLLVQVRPATESTLPNLDEENVRFERGVVRSFVLLGEVFTGVVGPARLDSLLEGSVLYLKTYVQRADGGRDGLSASTLLLPDGSLELHLPQPGRFSAHLTRAGTHAYTYYWPDSLDIALGDIFHLELPVVECQLKLTLGGLPLPPGEIRCRIDSPGIYPYNRFWQTFFPDGSRESFQMLPLRGGDYFLLDIHDQPYPPVSGTPGLLSFVPVSLRIPPREEGDSLSFELGLYQLKLVVLDVNGDPLSRAIVRLYSEANSYYDCLLYTDDEGRAIFRANPIGHELRVEKDGYVDARRYFTVTGDMQMTVTLQPIPTKN